MDLDYYLISKLSFSEHLVIGLNILCSILCLLASWLFHTMFCHSEKVSSIFVRLDYAGICSLITTSSFPYIYYSFKDHKIALVTHMVMMAVGGIICTTLTLNSKFNEREYYTLRLGICFIKQLHSSLLLWWIFYIFFILYFYTRLKFIWLNMVAIFYSMP